MQVSRGIWGGGGIFNSGPLRMHFQNSGAIIRVFEESTGMFNFGFFIQWQRTLHVFPLAKSYEPLGVLVSVLNHVICKKNWVSFQRKIGSEFTWNSWQMSPAASSYWKPCKRSPMVREEGEDRERPLPGLRCIFYHAYISISITTSWVLKGLVTCHTTYRTSLHINKCELWNFQPTVSTGHVHSTLNKTSFEI